jgi:molybdopterin-guanine dinucleotide biosynthesis protein A
MLAQRAAGYGAAVFTVDGADQPLPGWYSATVVPTLEDLVAGGERRLRALLDAPAIRSLRIPADHTHEQESGGRAFARANTPQEWDALCACLDATQGP